MTVSVIIPTRDRADLLEAAIRSVRGQTRAVQEVIVVDDGSGAASIERSRRVASELGATLIELPAQVGAAAARNAGIARARGGYLLFLDDDDLLHPAMIETSLGCLEADPTLDVSVCLYEVFFTQRWGGDQPLLSQLFDYRLLDRHPLRLIDRTRLVDPRRMAREPLSVFLRYPVPVHACLVRRAALADRRFAEDLRQGEDSLLWLELAARGCRFGLHTDVHAYVRRHAGNTTGSRARYYDEILAFYRQVLARRIPLCRADRFVVHLKLAHFEAMRGNPRLAPHLLRLLGCPDLLLREGLDFGRKSLAARWRLARYYFQP